MLPRRTGADNDDVELVGRAHRDRSSGWLCLGYTRYQRTSQTRIGASGAVALQPAAPVRVNRRMGKVDLTQRGVHRLALLVGQELVDAALVERGAVR
jgi:hypothetical protein